MKAQFFKCPQELEAESFALHALNLNLYLRKVQMFFNAFSYFDKIDVLSVFKVKITLNINNATALTCCVF